MNREYDLPSIEALSGGVFAVAMTLLLGTVPVARNAADLGGEPVGQYVLHLLPQLVSFAISFFVTGVFWVAHHRLFRYLTGADLGLVLINFLLLFGIAIQPLTTGLLGGFPHTRATVVLYAANLVLIGVAQFFLWAYAFVDRRLVDPALDAAVVRAALVSSAVPPVVFLASIPVSSLDTTAAMLCWILPIPLAFARHVRDRKPA